MRVAAFTTEESATSHTGNQGNHGNQKDEGEGGDEKDEKDGEDRGDNSGDKRGDNRGDNNRGDEGQAGSRFSGRYTRAAPFKSDSNVFRCEDEFPGCCGKPRECHQWYVNRFIILL